MTAITARDIDRHIGARIRLRRKSLGMSQSDVGNKIDISYQQFQRYETGDSRVAASTLYEIGIILDMPVSWFFEGLPQTADEPDHGRLALVSAFLSSPQGLRLVESFCKLPDGAARYKLVEFLEAFVANRN